MNTTEFKKLKLALYSKLSGLALADKTFNQCLAVFNYAESVHTGKRKDGSEEFYHQMNMLGYAMNLHSMLAAPALIYSALLLHDTLEDNQHLRDEIRSKFPDLYVYCERLSKIDSGVKKPSGEYFGEIANCPVCSVVKGIDRIHNLSSMVVPFSIEKQSEYIDEAKSKFLPMIKKAKGKFPEMLSVYELIKGTINIQCDTIKACYKKGGLKEAKATA